MADKIVISKDSLLKYGMKETTDTEKMFYPLKKVISTKAETSGEELAICVTNQRNVNELCLTLPDGGILYISPKSIENLKIFEECITSYEPNY